MHAMRLRTQMLPSEPEVVGIDKRTMSIATGTTGNRVDRMPIRLLGRKKKTKKKETFEANILIS